MIEYERKAKRIEELTVTIGDITAGGLADVIAIRVIEALEPLLRGKQLLSIDRDLAGKPGIAKIYPKVTRFPATVVAELTEGSDMPQVSTEQTFSQVKVEPKWYGTFEEITGQTLQTMDWNALEITRRGLARAMARKIDEVIWESLLNKKNTTEDITSANTTFTAGATTVIALANWTAGGILRLAFSAAVSGVELQKVDYFKGTLLLLNNSGSDIAPSTKLGEADYDYIGGNRSFVNAKTKAQLGLEDLLSAKLVVQGKYGMPDTVIANENQVAEIMLDNRVQANEAYNQNVLLKGAVARLYNMDVLDTQLMPEGVAVICQKGIDLGVYLEKEPIRIQVEAIEKRIGDKRIKIWTSFGIGILNEDLICIVVNAQKDAADL